VWAGGGVVYRPLYKEWVGMYVEGEWVQVLMETRWYSAFET
jgi:hypothetical protein